MRLVYEWPIFSRVCKPPETMNPEWLWYVEDTEDGADGKTKGKKNKKKK